MFGRRKSKDERKEKKKHKNSMSQSDLSKLEEVGIKRGFFSKIVRREKEDNESINQQSSVLQKATKYGQVVRRMSSSSQSSDVSKPLPKPSSQTPNIMRPQSMQITREPPQAVIRSSLYSQQSSYDVPKPPVRKQRSKNAMEYAAPRPTTPISTQKLPIGRVHSSGPVDKLRVVTLTKRDTGDFGLSLRRSAVVEYRGGQAVTKTAFFAEPGAAMLADVSYNEKDSTMLHFGDLLVEIDGFNVENALREEVVGRIRSADTLVNLLVRSTQDDQQETSNRTQSTTNKSTISLKSEPQTNYEDNVELNQPHQVHADISGARWLKKDEVWLKTADGLTRAHLVVIDKSRNDVEVADVVDGKCRVQISEDDQILVVSEDDVEKCNSSEFDRANNLTMLNFLNESSFLHTLSEKYKHQTKYTYLGPHLISLSTTNSSFNSLISDADRYKKKKISEAHIYAVAQKRYKSMMREKTDQTMVNIGSNHPSKQWDIYHTLEFFIFSYTTNNPSLNVNKLSALINVVRSLTWAETGSCNSSRAVLNFQLSFTRSGTAKSLSTQVIYLDHIRVASRNDGEANFNLFYEIFYGADSDLKKELALTDEETNPIMFGPFQPSTSFKNRCKTSLSTFKQSLHVLGFTDRQLKAVLQVVTICIHLGMANFKHINNSSKIQFESIDHAQKAANLLGLTTDQLCAIIFHSGTAGSLRRGASFNQHDDHVIDGATLLGNFIGNLYKEVVHMVTTIANRNLNHKDLITCSNIRLIDTPGYVTSRNRVSRAFNDVIFNYIQDRFNILLHRHSVIDARHRYLQEGVDVDVTDGDDVIVSRAADVIDCVQHRGKGLLRLLDEEETEEVEALVSRILRNNTEGGVVQRSRNRKCFVLRHHASTLPVEYDVTEWKRATMWSLQHHGAVDMLKNCNKCLISELFGRKGSIVSTNINSPLEGGTLHRAESFQKTFTSNRSFCDQLKLLLDNIFEKMMSKSELSFMLSFDATNSDLMTSSFDFASMRRQLLGFRALDVARAYKQGFPDNLVLREFLQRFTVLCETPPSGENEQQLIEDILITIDINQSLYRIGISRVFFRAGTIEHLDELRDDKVSARIVALQSRCRGFLARRRFHKRKVQDVAIRCLQRNIRLFMGVRQWSWWKLVTRILPLIQVTRADDALKESEAEVEILKEKILKLQKEKEEMEVTSEKYEHKVEELLHLLEEEQSSSNHSLQLLDSESKEKKQLQAEQLELLEKINELERRLKEANKKNSRISTKLPSESSDASDEEVDQKSKYEKTIRQLRQKMDEKLQQQEEDLESVNDNKKALERKLLQMQEELDEHVRLESQSKKKIYKLQSELGDLKIHLEETAAKNHELEKKQKKVDSEAHLLSCEIGDLRSAKERLQREKDRSFFDNNNLNKQLEEKMSELEVMTSQVKFLESELDQSNVRDSGDKQAVNKLKKKIRDLEAKVEDQEEELDEQAATIQTLEQTKERLEMSSDQARSHLQREIAAKDAELDEFRNSSHKKLKLLEEQLLEADEERSAQMKRRRQLEQQVFDLKEAGVSQREDEYQKQMRRDVKRYKSLLADAQTALDHLKTNASNKQHLRQLKTKLEESEHVCAAAVKSRRAMEVEIEDLQTQLDDICRSKQEVESKLSQLQHEVNSLHSKLEEDQEDSNEVLVKFKNLLFQQSEDKKKMNEMEDLIEELRSEKSSLEDRINLLQNQIDCSEEILSQRPHINRLEAKVKELEAKNDYLKSVQRRLEVQLSRSKENVDKLMGEKDAQAASLSRDRDSVKRINKQLRELKDEQVELIKKERDAVEKRHQVELELEEERSQVESLQSDLKLAFRRIESLQTAFEELEDSDFMYSDSSDDSDCDEEDYDDEDFYLIDRSSRKSRLSSHSSLAQDGGRSIIDDVIESR